MFGIRFIKSQPTVHLIQFKRGKVVVGRRRAGPASLKGFAQCGWPAPVA